MDASHLFPGMNAQEIADLERATGLLVVNAEAWSAEDYDAVIAYLRRKALTPPAFMSAQPRAWGSCYAPESRRSPVEV
jgi:hypothetical protein